MKNVHLLGLKDYPSEDIQLIIDTAYKFKEVLNRPIKKVPSLKGKTIVNINISDNSKIAKFKLKTLRNIDRKSINILRNKEISLNID